MYVNEVAPARLRGSLGTAFQLSICLGILISYGAGAALQTLMSDKLGWRVMLIAGALPGVLLLASALFVPESPVWKAERQRKKAGALSF